MLAIMQNEKTKNKKTENRYVWKELGPKAVCHSYLYHSCSYIKLFPTTFPSHQITNIWITCLLLYFSLWNSFICKVYLSHAQDCAGPIYIHSDTYNIKMSYPLMSYDFRKKLNVPLIAKDGVLALTRWCLPSNVVERGVLKSW